MTFLHQLKNISGTIAKGVLLSTSNNLYKNVFRYTYNPHKMYYQRFIDIDWDTIQEPCEHMFHILDMLASRQVTGAAARELVINHSYTYGDLIKLICNKDLDIGISATTLNKTFGKGFIPTFKVQLAEEVDIKKIQLPKLMQLKYNGTRVIARKENGVVTFKTRNGLSFQYDELAKVILLYTEDDNFILDGELTFGDSQGENHAKVSGIVNSALKGTPIKDGLNLVFHVFDFMSIEHFDKCECPIVYSDRFIRLFNRLNSNSKIKIANTSTVHNLEDLQKHFDFVIANRYEGLILKDANHLYSFKRSKDWIKLKSIKDCTLQVINFIPGTGKYEGMIGALQCEGFAEGSHVIVNVGSGLSDSDRAEHPSRYIGKFIDVQYNTVINNSKDNTLSLFLPRFITIRGDLNG